MEKFKKKLCDSKLNIDMNYILRSHLNKKQVKCLEN